MRIDKQLIVLGLLSNGRYTVDLEKGRVISLIGKEPRVMKPNVLPTGYEQLGLDLGYKVKFPVYVHQVIYLAKYGTYNPEYTIDHINRNTGDNRIVNLRCGSHAANIANQDRSTRKKGASKPRKTEQEKQEIVQKWKEGHSIASIAKDFKCARQNVYVILANRGCNTTGRPLPGL